jgi:hypothetical protein
MVKVLIYSSKEIYDTASYVGRAEAHIIAYRKPDGHFYEVVKNRTSRNLGPYTTFQGLQLELKWIERDELDQELKNYKNFYKNAGVAQG